MNATQTPTPARFVRASFSVLNPTLVLFTVVGFFPKYLFDLYLAALKGYGTYNRTERGFTVGRRVARHAAIELKNSGIVVRIAPACASLFRVARELPLEVNAAQAAERAEEREMARELAYEAELSGGAGLPRELEAGEVVEREEAAREAYKANFTDDEIEAHEEQASERCAYNNLMDQGGW